MMQKQKNQCDGLPSLTQKLIKKISVKSLKAEPLWFQHINQGFEKKGDDCFYIRRQPPSKKTNQPNKQTKKTKQNKGYLKMPGI